MPLCDSVIACHCDSPTSDSRTGSFNIISTHNTVTLAASSETGVV